MRLRSRWLGRIPLAIALAAVLGWLPLALGRSDAWARLHVTGVAHLVELRGELARVRAENAALFAENRRLRAELGLYDDDDLAAVERIARDDLGLVARGEIVWKVEDAPRGAAEGASRGAGR